MFLVLRVGIHGGQVDEDQKRLLKAERDLRFVIEHRSSFGILQFFRRCIKQLSEIAAFFI